MKPKPKKPIELWKQIPEFPFYQISNLGNFKSFLIYEEGKLIKVAKTQEKHQYITLFSPMDDKAYVRSVRKLVAEAFVKGQTPLKTQVAVLDGNIQNVKAYNLIWVTNSENRIATYIKPRLLNEKQVEEIFDKYVPVHYNLRMLSAEYNVNILAIWQVVKNKYKPKSKKL
jgi:hypothetical protein